MEKTMVATSADWSFDTRPNVDNQVNDYIAQMKAARAYWFYVMTSETTARSMSSLKG